MIGGLLGLYWEAGSTATAAPPPPPSGGLIGRPYRYTVPAPLVDAQRRQLLDEDELLLLIAAALAGAGLLH